ncbi:DUF317 domain-containing protein [Streptomyces sp. NPDC004690]
MTSIDARVRLDTHPTHSSAVVATVVGTAVSPAVTVLLADGWQAIAPNVFLLIRIDHEEPYWAERTAEKLDAAGVVTEITDPLREAIDEEWTWGNYPMSWCTRSEIREVSDQAQKIYDAIQSGRLLIHAHADDHGTTVAVGTYLDTGKSVYLHGENHLRQIAGSFDSVAAALTAFERFHGADLRPGSAPMTDTEREAAEARTVLAGPTPILNRYLPHPEVTPARARGAGGHDVLLEEFLDAHDDWEKWRTWSDEKTHAVHESQTLCIERVHEAAAHETGWTVAAYETPVSQRMWHLTATASTPEPVVRSLLNHLADKATRETDIGTPIDEKTVTAATQPLTDTGWKQSFDGRWIRWTNAAGDAGVRFDAFAAQMPLSALTATWTIWAGPDHEQPVWAVHASPYVPASLLADVAVELTANQGIRTQRPGIPNGTAPRTTTAGVPAAPQSSVTPRSGRNP